MAEKSLTLKVTTPTETRTATCDAVTLTVADGSLGIRPGHTEALLAIAEGPIVGRMGGNEILRLTVAPGFAVVRDDTVTVIVDRVRA